MTIARWALLTAVGLSGASCSPDPADTSSAPGDGVTAGRPEPGKPASFYGPKCTATVSYALLPECISGVIAERDGLVHLFLNFCVASGVDRCAQNQAPSPLYVSLLLPMATWSEGHYTHAVAGLVDLQLSDGRHHRVDTGRGEPLPLDLVIRSQPNGSGAATLYGELELAIPRVDAAGEPFTLHARVN